MNNAQRKLVNEIVKAHEAAEAARQAELPWGERERAVTLTNDEWNRLRCYLLMTTKHREGERDAWAKLAEEKDASGAPVFPSAAANVEYWNKMVEFIDAVGEKIDGVNAILKGE